MIAKELFEASGDRQSALIASGVLLLVITLVMNVFGPVTGAVGFQAAGTQRGVPSNWPKGSNPRHRVHQRKCRPAGES